MRRHFNLQWAYKPYLGINNPFPGYNRKSCSQRPCPVHFLFCEDLLLARFFFKCGPWFLYWWELELGTCSWSWAGYWQLLLSCCYPRICLLIIPLWRTGFGNGGPEFCPKTLWQRLSSCQVPQLSCSLRKESNLVKSERPLFQSFITYFF